MTDTLTPRPAATDQPPRARPGREVTGFLAAGATAFVTRLAVFNLLVAAGIGPLTSNALGMAISVAVAYLGNRYLAFGHRRAARPAREAVVFLAVNGVAFALAEAILASAYLFTAQHDRLVINVLTVAGIGIGTVIRFLAYRHLVFTARPATGGPGLPAPQAGYATNAPPTAQPVAVGADAAASLASALAGRCDRSASHDDHPIAARGAAVMTGRHRLRSARSLAGHRIQLVDLPPTEAVPGLDGNGYGQNQPPDGERAAEAEFRTTPHGAGTEPNGPDTIAPEAP